MCASFHIYLKAVVDNKKNVCLDKKIDIHCEKYIFTSYVFFIKKQPLLKNKNKKKQKKKNKKKNNKKKQNKNIQKTKLKKP